MTSVILSSPRVGAARLVEITPMVSAAIVRTCQNRESLLQGLCDCSDEECGESAADDEVASD